MRLGNNCRDFVCDGLTRRARRVAAAHRGRTVDLEPLKDPVHLEAMLKERATTCGIDVVMDTKFSVHGGDEGCCC